MDSIEKRLNKYRFNKKLEMMFVYMTTIGIVAMLTSIIPKSDILLIIGVILSTIGMIGGMVMGNIENGILKPFYTKLKSINNWKDRAYYADGFDIIIYGCGRDSHIKIGLPDISGATVEYHRRHFECSDSMERALKEYNMDVYEFYLRFIERILLNRLAETYTEIYAKEISQAKAVTDFIKSRMEEE